MPQKNGEDASWLILGTAEAHAVTDADTISIYTTRNDGHGSTWGPFRFPLPTAFSQDSLRIVAPGSPAVFAKRLFPSKPATNQRWYFRWFRNIFRMWFGHGASDGST